MTYSRTCGIATEDCDLTVCGCVPGPHRPGPVVDAAGGSEPVLGVGVAVDTSERCEAGSVAHSKPKVSAHYGCAYDDTYGLTFWWRHWRWWCPTCRVEVADFCTQPDAFAAALAHVAEHHTPKPDPEDLTTMRRLLAWADGDRPLQRAHNTPGGCRD